MLPPTEQQSEDFLSELNTRIMEAQKKSGLSTYMLAKRAGIDRRTLKIFIGGQGNPTVRTLFKIAVALDMDLGKAISASIESSRNGIE